MASFDLDPRPRWKIIGCFCLRFVRLAIFAATLGYVRQLIWFLDSEYESFHDSFIMLHHALVASVVWQSFAVALWTYHDVWRNFTSCSMKRFLVMTSVPTLFTAGVALGAAGATSYIDQMFEHVQTLIIVSAVLEILEIPPLFGGREICTPSPSVAPQTSTEWVVNELHS